MMAILRLLGKWFLKIPVLFAHFPGPTAMLVFIALTAGGTLGSCVTHRLEAGARAELKIELANAKAGYSERIAEAAEKREEVIANAAATQRAIDMENQRAWREQLGMLAVTANDKAALARLGNKIEDLHRDPAFTCRRLPLPDAYLDGLRIESWTAPAASGNP